MQIGGQWRHKSNFLTKACIGIKVIKDLNNDAINKPQTGEASVYEFHQMIDQGAINKGEYHVKVNATHALCRVPLAWQKRLKMVLEEIVKQDILALVTTPTAWVSSMVTTPKPNGGMRICLDLKDPSKAIQREHIHC